MYEEGLNNNDNINLYHELTARTIVLTMVLAFVLPVVIMALALLRIQVWPGGKFTLYIYDLKAQFAPVISSLRYLGKGDSSLLLSFFGALGNNAFLNYNAYILDPTMWVTVFFPLEQMPDVIYFITLIKIGLCGVGASTFLLFRNKQKRYPPAILILSVCYALMSYNIIYSECLLWFNVIALAPLALLGIEHIIKGKRGGVYILCMTLSLYYNGQLTYMTGIFAILYLFLCLSEVDDKKFKIVVRFVVCNVICAGLYMPVILPVMFNILNGRLKTNNYLTGSYFYYPFWKVLKQFFSCQYSTIESGGLPNIFCGTFIPLIAILALVLPVKPIITRVMATCIMAFFLASFSVVRLNQFWHGFNEPNSYPARYSFLLCLYLIILVYQVVCFAYEKVSLPKSVINLLYGFVMVITCIEMYLNAGFILASLNIEMKYLISNEYQSQLQEMKAAQDSIDDKDFYRIGRDLQFCYNDGMLFGYNGIGYFSSMFERNTMDFIGKLGYSQYEHVLTGIGGTPISESILGIRYKILNRPELFGYYEMINCNGSYYLQYNENALPLGFLIDYKMFEPESDKNFTNGVRDHNAFVFQEYILSELRGRKIDAYDNIKYTLEEVDSDDYARHIRIRFTVKNDKPIWMYCKDEHDGIRVTVKKRNNSSSENITADSEFASTGFNSVTTDEKPVDAFLKVNDKRLFSFINQISTMCTYLGTFQEGEEIEVEAACVNSFDDPWIVYYNADECEAALKDIKETGLEIIEHRNGVIKGKIHVRDKDDLMVMTLPYMRGYRVKIDGVLTPYGAYRNALLAIKMPPGEHVVEVSFVPYGLIPGIGIGMIALIIAIMYLKVPSDRLKYLFQ